MATEYDQSKVAYEDEGPKEVRDSQPKRDNQFPGMQMPQTNKMQKTKRHKEYR